MDKLQNQRAVKWALFSLAIVALYGTVMRYKIAFNFPYFEQKHLLHAHSHFAFSGWVSHFIYAGLASVITPFLSGNRKKKYWFLLLANLFCAAGMLIAFTVQGYKAVSIGFSTLSIVQSIWFTCVFMKDSRLLPAGHPSLSWAKTGLLLNVVSAAGPLYLGYMMATHHINQQIYLAAVYYYLHFQYNGWFFFGCMAIIVSHLPAGMPSLKRSFQLFAVAAIPTYLLSILWAKLPTWLYLFGLLAGLLQLGAWLVMLVKLAPVLKMKTREHWKSRSIYMILFYASAFALTLKFILQAVSAIPSLSQMVFGFRPVVIAYLHLVLLGVYSLFFIGYWVRYNYILLTGFTRVAILAFLAGVAFNELLLALQGIGGFGAFAVPHIQDYLFYTAVLLLVSSLSLALGNAITTRHLHKTA
ncbi:hypothetical protein [Filimonas effusa]|uniref:NnrS family protein n=1 Tax=Filimonas effusa TaxID=2508721 RepID=A0A4Q1D5U7_9BACT|nr:hypothetical protein [Filimonas effusa]RXK83778.1 hypothetical protein ESB13_17035 [Filimonas effusa]